MGYELIKDAARAMPAGEKEKCFHEKGRLILHVSEDINTLGRTKPQHRSRNTRGNWTLTVSDDAL